MAAFAKSWRREKSKPKRVGVIAQTWCGQAPAFKRACPLAQLGGWGRAGYPYLPRASSMPSLRLRQV